MTREEAIELLVNATYSHEWQGNEQLTKANHMAIEALQELPKRRKEVKRWKRKALQQERPKGKWIPNENDTYSCSLCQSWLPAEQKEYARYCLYCGARMDKEKK